MLEMDKVRAPVQGGAAPRSSSRGVIREPVVGSRGVRAAVIGEPPPVPTGAAAVGIFSEAALVAVPHIL